MNKKTKIKISIEELETHLKEQIGFLIDSCAAFDAGNYAEAKRLAVSLRILLHDGKNSNSLFAQMSLKSLLFVNTSNPYDPNNLFPHLGLLSFSFDDPSGRRPCLIPKGTPDQLPKQSRIKFWDWWTMTVISAGSRGNKTLFSRKDLIQHVANTDGGAHIDPNLEEHYLKLSRWNSIGICTEQNGINEPIESPVLFCIRQIAHELLITLQNSHGSFFAKPYQYNGIALPSINTSTGVPVNSSVMFAEI